MKAEVSEGRALPAQQLKLLHLLCHHGPAVIDPAACIMIVQGMEEDELLYMQGATSVLAQRVVTQLGLHPCSCSVPSTTHCLGHSMQLHKEDMLE